MDRPTSIHQAYSRALEAKQAAAEQQPARGTPSSVARLDEYVELSRTNPAAFAALPADIRQGAADRALNLDARARAEQGATQ